MILGILSDTHNQTARLNQALEVFRAAGVRQVIHCGDLTDVSVAVSLAEFPVICTIGNGDWNAPEIRRILAFYNPSNTCALSFEGRLDETPLAVTHGHLPGILERLIACGEFDYVFHGHTHHRRDERVGRTRVINPGALGGTGRETRSIALLDLQTDTLTFHNLE